MVCVDLRLFVVCGVAVVVVVAAVDVVLLSHPIILQGFPDTMTFANPPGMGVILIREPYLDWE